MPDDTSPSGFLADLSQTEHDALLRLGRRRRFRGGSMLFREGERSDGVFLVLSGRVKVSYFTDEGREIVLAVRGPGDLLGELSTIDGEPRSAGGAALGPVEVVLVGAEDFTAFLERYPRASLALLRTLSRRLREATRRRIEYGAYDALGRVARRLVELADQVSGTSGRPVRIPLHLSQEELAGWIGASRESVSKALRALRERGWIRTQRRGIIVLDLNALRQRSS